MSNIEDRIRKSLSAEDQAFLAELEGDGSLYREVTAVFQGRMRWLNALGWLMGFVFFIVAVYCGWHFMTETDPRGMQLWGAGTALAVFALGMIKLWFWMELKTNSIVREIKRVELQVASLVASKRGPLA